MRAILVLLLLSSVATHAQRTPPWYVGARVHYGFLWPHRPAAWYLVNDHATAFELNMERRFRNDRPWQRSYKGAGFGFGVLYSGMANKEIFGGGVRFIPYLDIPFINRSRSNFGVRLGWGVGYIFKPFDRVANFKQITTGTRLNTAIQLMLQYRLEVRRSSFAMGVSLDHWSNGSFKLPNLGANLLSLNAGIGYAISTPAGDIEIPDTAKTHWRKREQSIVGAFGISEVARPLSGQYTVYSIVSQVQWQVTPKSSFSAGIDLFNKGSLGTIHPELKEMDRLSYTQLGVHGGWALGFGRGEVLLQMGAYAYTPYPDESALFHRLGMRYRSGRHLIWHIALKSHYAVADHWEWGVGYRWH